MKNDTNVPVSIIIIMLMTIETTGVMKVYSSAKCQTPRQKSTIATPVVGKPVSFSRGPFTCTFDESRVLSVSPGQPWSRKTLYGARGGYTLETREVDGSWLYNLSGTAVPVRLSKLPGAWRAPSHKVGAMTCTLHRRGTKIAHNCSGSFRSVVVSCNACVVKPARKLSSLQATRPTPTKCFRLEGVMQRRSISS